jgi:hypothetical protein
MRGGDGNMVGQKKVMMVDVDRVMEGADSGSMEEQMGRAGENVEMHENQEGCGSKG